MSAWCWSPGPLWPSACRLEAGKEAQAWLPPPRTAPLCWRTGSAGGACASRAGMCWMNANTAREGSRTRVKWRQAAPAAGQGTSSQPRPGYCPTYTDLMVMGLAGRAGGRRGAGGRRETQDGGAERSISILSVTFLGRWLSGALKLSCHSRHSGMPAPPQLLAPPTSYSLPGPSQHSARPPVGQVWAFVAVRPAGPVLPVAL